MSFLRTSLLYSVALTGLSATLLAKPVPTTLNYNVVTCGHNARCSNEVLFGRIYKVIETAKLTVMVSLSNEGAYTRADVSITNHTDYAQHISPEDFRVEEVSPKHRVLLYVSPSELQHIAPPATTGAVPIVAAPSIMAKGAAAAPSVDELFAQAKREEAAKVAAKEALERAAAQRDLTATLIPAHDVVRGRVFFERNPKATQVNVVLPVAGLVFEFPYAMTF